MSKERKLRREERERVAAEAAAVRAADADKRNRREARVRSVTSKLPLTGRKHSRQSGPWAERRRRQVGATIAILVALNVLVWAFFPEWSARFLALAVSLLAAPVLYTMLFRRN